MASSGGLAWYWHFFFNLRLVYVFPLALLFLVWFFEKRRPEFLWLSGLCWVFAGQGASYILCIWLFVFLIVSAIQLAVRPDALRLLMSRSWRNLVTFSLFLSVAGSFVYVSATSVQGFVFTKADRDPLSGKVLLEDYLHHGGNPRLTRVVRDLLSGDSDVNQWDSSFYAGLLPLFFFAWGLARERSAWFWAIACAGIALVWLAFGGAFAAATYYLPLTSASGWTRSGGGWPPALQCYCCSRWMLRVSRTRRSTRCWDYTRPLPRWGSSSADWRLAAPPGATSVAERMPGRGSH